jgi:endonuclease-3 related protein
MSADTSNTLQDIYRRLLDRYGPQHWWPADEPFEVMVGAILTQSTAWTNVEKAIRNLKAANAVSPAALRHLGLDELATLVRPSGYYTVKARKLKALVDWLEEHDDDPSRLSAENTDVLRQELLAVYGIGEETADSILLYAIGKPVFVIDAYTRRIVDRLGLHPATSGYGSYQRLFVNSLRPDVTLFNEYHALFVQHGKTACRKVPLCQQCCLVEMCEYGRSTTAA